jgi:hypothetical protein
MMHEQHLDALVDRAVPALIEVARHWPLEADELEAVNDALTEAGVDLSQVYGGE